MGRVHGCQCDAGLSGTTIADAPDVGLVVADKVFGRGEEREGAAESVSERNDVGKAEVPVSIQGNGVSITLTPTSTCG